MSAKEQVTTARDRAIDHKINQSALKAARTVIKSGRNIDDPVEATAVALTTLSRTVAMSLYALLQENPDRVRECIEATFIDAVLEIVDERHKDRLSIN